MDKKKVIVYVDGYNFYYGLKNGAVGVGFGDHFLPNEWKIEVGRWLM
jgi:hypothetical protein